MRSKDRTVRIMERFEYKNQMKGKTVMADVCCFRQQSTPYNIGTVGGSKMVASKTIDSGKIVKPEEAQSRHHVVFDE